MEIQFIAAPPDSPLKRIYIATAILRNFRAHQNVEAHLFRYSGQTSEHEELKGLNLVGAPDPLMPASLLEGATEEAALQCIMEAFTEQEAREIAGYLARRYDEQIAKLIIYPLDLPVPLGVGPLNSIPESASSGFLNFSKARDYPFPFALKAYYDLGDKS